MGQTVKLRRSAISGKIPINSQLQLGELSMNTTDGKIFLSKSGSQGPSIEEVIITNTQNNGSLDIVGSISGSHFTGSFIGDGSGLYNIPASGVTGLSLDRIASSTSTASIDADGLHINTDTTVTGSLTATEFTGSGLGLTNVPIKISGSDAGSTSIDSTFTRIKFDDSTGIKISGTTGGDAVVFLSGVAAESESSEGRTAKLEVTSATSTWTLNHNLNEKHPSIEVFDSNDEVIIPQKIEATSNNQVVVSFASPQTGTVTATVGGGLPSIESGYTDRVLSVDSNGVATWKTGILSGSVDFSTLVDTGSFNTYTSSNDDTNGTQNGRLNSLESFTSSIDNTYATDTDVTTLRTDLNTYTSSTDGRLDSLETTSGSSNLRLDYIESVTSSHNGRLNSLETTSGSHDGRLDSIESKTGSFLVSNDLSTIEGKIGSLETTSGSHEGKLSSLETISASHDGRLDSLETTSGSHNGRLTDLETFETKVDTGLEFTGSNVTIKGNLLVKGTETRVDSTTVDIDDNILSLNGSGAANAGIEVRDTESPGVLSGSLIYDTGDNTWKAGTKGSEERLLINSDLTTLDGRLDSLESTSGSHEDRLDRIETSTSSLNSFTSSINTTIKDKLNNDGVISGSVQIDHDATTNYEANEHIDHTTITIGSGKGLTGGGTIDTSRSLTLNTGSNHFLDGVKSKLNTETVVSGSEQIDITGTTNYNLVDGRLDSIESFTSSIDLTYATDDDVTDLRNDLNSYTSSNDDTNGTQNGRLNSLETTSGSHDGRLDSLETTSGSHNSRLDSIESNTGSYLTSYNDEYTTGATFSTSNGVVTFTRNDGDQYTVDLDGRYLTSFTETDPVFTAHAAYDITSTQITNWDTAYGWGDHSQAGYLTSYNNEYTTGATFNGSNGIITFTRNDGDTYTLNISSTLTDINVTGGTYDDSTQTLTLNKSNGSSIDVTGFAVDTVLHTTGATFNSSNGVVTFTKNGGDTYTVDLDGRYLTSFTETDPIFTAHVASDITSTNIENWNTAYGWGDHSQAGYLTSYNNEYTTGATFNSGNGVVTFTRNDGDQFTVDLDGRYLTSYNDEYTTGATFNSGNGVITFTRNDGDTFTVDIDGRFLTSFTETDPVFTAHAAYDITSTQITNWDTAYGWGDHGTAGYLTSYNNEYTTGATFNGGNGIITFTRNDGDTFTLDISATLTDINVTGGTYDDSTQTLTLNKSNGGSIDISGFAVDTVLHTTGATFDTSDGLVTFTKNNNTTFSVDLDGRYSLSNHNHDSTYLKLAGGTLTGGLNGTTGTFSGKGTFDNLELTSGNRHLTFTESADDWFIYNDQQDNGIVLYNGTGGVEIHYSGSSIADFDSTGIIFRDNVTMAGSSTIDMGTNTITDAKVGQWDTAYGWGDHGSAGYLTSYNDEYTTGATFNTGTGVITFTRNDGDTYTVDIDGRFLTSFTETDPIFTAHAAYDITSTQITNWDTAYGWGDHSQAGYLTSSSTQSKYLRSDTDDTTTGTLTIGDGSNQARLKLQKADNDTADHIEFYNGTTRVGEIGVQDTTWLRINNVTNTNIYTPRYIRADAGFFVDGTSKGINGSGNFIGGTIAGASDANVTNWDTAYGWGDHSTAGYLTSFSEADTLDSVVSRGSSTSSTVSVGRLNIGSTADSDFLTGNSELSANGYIMTKAIVNTSETGTGPAAIVFGNGSTYGSDQISFITVGSTRMYIDSDSVDVSVQLNMSADIDMGTNTITDTKVGQWDTAYGWGDHSQAGYLTSYNNEYTTGATFNGSNGIITFTRNDGDTYTVDISSTLTDINVTGGTYNDSNQTLTLNKSNGTSVDVTGFAVDTVLHTTGATFNSSNGVITFTKNGGDTYTVDIDGRFLTSYTESQTLNDVTTLGATTSNSITVGKLTSTWGEFTTTDGTNPGADDLNVSGYGIQGNRTSNPIYLHNYGNGGIRLGVNTTLGDGTNGVLITDTTSTFYTNVSVTGTLSASGYNNANWDTAYGWGDHSAVGYITGYTETDTLATVTSRGATTTSDITTGNHTISQTGPTLTLDDNNNAGGGGAAGKIIFKNTAGNAIGIGYTADDTASSDLIISTNAGSTYGGYLGLDAGGISDAQADIILDPKTKVQVKGDIDMGTNDITDTKVGQWDTAYGWGNHAGLYMTQGQTLTGINTIVNGGNRYDPSTDNPTNEHYAVLTYGNGGNVTGQLATHFQTGKLYSRGHNNSWSGWRAYWSDSDFTSTNVSNWDTAYGWGDHSTEGYWSDSDFTSTNVSNWNTAYGWGDHASAGYITSPDGGNATTLDGVDSTQFLRSDTADTFTGTITMGTQKALVANNYGRGVYGLYSASRYQHVWSMGTAYNLSDDGTASGNLYGLAFTHTNVGGQSKSGLAHQLLIMDNGVTKSAIGRGIWTDGTITTTSHGDSSQWNTAYGWGDHASGGYASSSHTHSTSDITSGTFAAARFATSTRYDIGLISGVSSQSRDKLRVWADGTYSIGMKSGYDYGHIGSGEYAMSFQMSNTAGRGWWWGDTSHSDDQGAASITTEGKMVIAKSLSVGQGESITNPSDTPLYVEGTTAGETVFEVQGTSGQLFSITDSLIGDIFEVSDISGIPILTVNSSGVVTVDDTLHVTGDVIAYYASDKRLKDNIKPIENAIDKIKMIGGYEFDWNINSRNNEGHDVGVIAQEIEEVLPELVGTRSDGYKGVKYEKLTALLIQSNKELIQRVEELEEKLNKSE